MRLAERAVLGSIGQSPRTSPYDQTEGHLRHRSRCRRRHGDAAVGAPPRNRAPRRHQRLRHRHDRAAAAPPVTFAHGDNGLGNIPIPAITATADPRPAAQLIIDLVRANPHEITIIAVGRMTNLAEAIARDPGIVPLVKAVSVMGGAFGRNGHFGNVTPVAEANIIGDAPAADIVFGANWPMTIVGLDVTHESVLTDEYVSALARDAGRDGAFLWEVSRFYAKFYTSSKQFLNGFAEHDSSAVAAALHPQFFTYEVGAVRVVPDGIARGQTILRPG